MEEKNNTTKDTQKQGRFGAYKGYVDFVKKQEQANAKEQPKHPKPHTMDR